MQDLPEMVCPYVALGQVPLQLSKKQTLSVSCCTADPPLLSTVAVVTLSAAVHFHVTNPQFTRASVASSAAHGAQLFP